MSNTKPSPNPKQTMRAATHSHYGPPKVLSPAEVAPPTVGDRDVLVQVHASAVTQGDRRLRAADYPGISAYLGRLATGLLRPRHRIPGSVFAGRVTAVGAAVTGFAVGDRVFGTCMHGAQAQYIAVPENSAMSAMPNGWTYAQAASVPYGGLTSLVFLRDLAKVRPGERVLIVGASGGVGRHAVQLAHHLGAHVTGVCSRDFDDVRALGADHVIDHRREDFTNSARPYDVILDCHEGNRFGRCRRVLTHCGRYLSLYVSAGLLLQMAFTAVKRGPRALCGVAMGNRAQMQDLQRLVEVGALRPNIARRFPLDDIAQAHCALEAGPLSGCVVIDIPQPSPARQQRPVPIQSNSTAATTAQPIRIDPTPTLGSTAPPTATSRAL